MNQTYCGFCHKYTDDNHTDKDCPEIAKIKDVTPDELIIERIEILEGKLDQIQSELSRILRELL